MINFQPDYQDCVDNEWDDLTQKYWNIMATSKSDVKRNALLSLRDEVTARLLTLPPSEEEVSNRNPQMLASND
jgi:hypothetical protein|tara:strand:- start:676 stop:894 length:219 start_codon:yes stop_codon:yes gene_type:complete